MAASRPTRRRQHDAQRVFSLVDPGSAAAVAAGRPERLLALLAGDARYAPLLGHAGAASLRRCQHAADTYLELVRVAPAARGQGE